MAGSIPRRWLALLALAGALMAISAASLASAPKAEAQTLTPYCNNMLYGPWGACWGNQRNHYAVYGWGEHAGVCVWASWNYGGGSSIPIKCSHAAGVGAYNPYGTYWNFFPAINNNSGISNRLHGVAYQ